MHFCTTTGCLLYLLHLHQVSLLRQPGPHTYNVSLERISLVLSTRTFILYLGHLTHPLYMQASSALHLCFVQSIEQHG